MSIGSRLKQARKAERLTQEQLAAKTGLKQSTISDLENGKSASSTSIATLAYALGVSALWLETGKGVEAASSRLTAVAPPAPKVARMVLAYEEEEALLDLFRRTDNAGRAEIMATAIEQARAAAVERSNKMQSDS